MKTTKKLFSNIRIIVLLVFLLLAVVAINPSFDSSGVAIRSIIKDSAADIAGISNPEAGMHPRQREVITEIDGLKIVDMQDFEEAISDLEVNDSITVVTNKGEYELVVMPTMSQIEVKNTEIDMNASTVVNDTSIEGNGSVSDNNTTTIKYIASDEPADIGLRVFDKPVNNIQKGLDLAGGTRVLLEPETELSPDDMSTVIDQMKQRLNVYGLSDITVREAGDLPPPLGEGKQYIMVEVAGVNEDEVKNLLAKQGKFESKIGNTVVFSGGDDILYVCRSAQCSGIDTQRGCQRTEDGAYNCRFRFSITLSQEAAQAQADATAKLSVVTVDENGNPLPLDNQYLNESIDLYLDDELVDSLNIGKGLQGNAVTEISISGSGSGLSREEAMLDALEGMKQLQTVMITGSLPVKLEIVKVDTSSPLLGDEFTKNILLVGALAILSVAGFIFIRYKSFKVASSIVFTMVSEVVLLLGIASLIGWNLDLAAIAGILIAVGTGVDDQIVITDEIRNKKDRDLTSWKQRVKKAFFMIMAAYFTTVVAMIPLYSAGAGLLKGFAITTIAGVTFGVFVTRPAFAAMLEIFVKKGE